MPHEKQIDPGFLTSAALPIIAVAMLVGLTIAEQIGKLYRPKER